MQLFLLELIKSRIVGSLNQQVVNNSQSFLPAPNIASEFNQLYISVKKQVALFKQGIEITKDKLAKPLEKLLRQTYEGLRAFATILDELKKASENIQIKNEKAKKKFKKSIEENEHVFD